jgi:hypothetical protein
MKNYFEHVGFHFVLPNLWLVEVKQHMNIIKLQKILPILALLLLFPISSAVSAETPGATPQDSSKKRIERVKAFLLRSTEEQNRSLTYVNGAIALLKEQTEAGAGRERDYKANERLALFEWYQRYADRLKEMSAELDADVSNYFSRPKAGAEWSTWYEELAQDYRKSAGELSQTVQKLEEKKKMIETRIQKLNTAVMERRVLVDKGDLELARELWPTYRVAYGHPEVTYKELTDEEVLRLRDELISLGERQKYFECLTELGKYEQVWLDIKAEDSSKLSELAEVVGSNDPGAVISAIKGSMKTYEADIAALKRRSGELDTKMRGITRTGTLKTLDRLEELSRYYEQMKSRFDRHNEWLKVQIGSYQADLVELGKEL